MFLDLQIKALMAKERIKQFFFDESGEVNIVATVVLIGIAVVLAVIFKDAIAQLLQNLFDSISGQANKAMESAKPIQLPSPTK